MFGQVKRSEGMKSKREIERRKRCAKQDVYASMPFIVVIREH